jgi:3-phenylpropionate/trans-cinnamate dioxygenase ferredoxin subunit
MEWHLVAEVGEIAPGKPKLVTVDNKQIGIFLEGGAYYAVLNYCPHAKAEICKGRVTGTLFSPAPGEYDMRHDALVLRCPWHHWEFALDTGKAVISSVKQRLKTYQVKVEDGSIYVEV